LQIYQHHNLVLDKKLKNNNADINGRILKANLSRNPTRVKFCQLITRYIRCSLFYPNLIWQTQTWVSEVRL